MRSRVLGLLVPLFVLLFGQSKAGVDHKEWEAFVSVGQFTTVLQQMTVDHDGNTFLVGTCRDSMYGYDDWLTVKLSPQGSILWSRRLPPASQTYTFCSGVAADSSGNLYEVGRMIAFDTVGSYLLKYTSDGVLEWHRYLEADFGTNESIAIDHAGNIIIAGTEWHSKADFRVSAFDPSGSRLWKDSVTDISSLGNFARQMRIGQDHSIYVVGLANGTGPTPQADSGDVVIAKYQPTGEFEWSARLDVGHLYNQPIAMALDSQGGVIVISTGLSSAHSNSTIAKYLSGGSLAWSQGFCWNSKCDTCTCNSIADALATDAGDTVYALGRHSESPQYSATYDVVADAIGPGGDIVWKHSYSKPPYAAPYYYSGSLRLDPLGNLNILAPIQENGTSNQLLVVKADAIGDTLWTALVDMGSMVYLDPRGFEVDGAGNMTVGATWTTNGTSNSHILITRYSASCCVGTTGNVNSAGLVDLSDLSLLIAYLTMSPKPALPCFGEANVDGTGIVDLSDLSLLISYLTAVMRPVLPNCL